MVTSAIASALRSIAKVSGTNRGSKSFELAGQLGMAPWQIDKARRQLTHWSPRGLADAVSAIALADAQVKVRPVIPFTPSKKRSKGLQLPVLCAKSGSV